MCVQMGERVLEEVLNGREVVEWRSLVRREEETTARALERAIFPAVEKLGFCDLELFPSPALAGSFTQFCFFAYGPDWFRYPENQ